MRDNTQLRLLYINKITLPETIIEMIKKFIFLLVVERKKKMQTYIINIINQNAYFSRLEPDKETDRYWTIYLNNSLIEHQSANCNICGNYIYALLDSERSKNDIYARAGLRVLYECYEPDEFDFNDVYNNEETFMLVKAKINCSCR